MRSAQARALPPLLAGALFMLVQAPRQPPGASVHRPRSLLGPSCWAWQCPAPTGAPILVPTSGAAASTATAGLAMTEGRREEDGQKDVARELVDNIVLRSPEPGLACGRSHTEGEKVSTLRMPPFAQLLP